MLTASGVTGELVKVILDLLVTTALESSQSCCFDRNINEMKFVFPSPVSHQSAALIKANTLMTHKHSDEDASSSSSVCFYSSVLRVEVSLSLCLSVPRSPAPAALSLIG